MTASRTTLVATDERAVKARLRDVIICAVLFILAVGWVLGAQQTGPFAGFAISFTSFLTVGRLLEYRKARRNAR